MLGERPTLKLVLGTKRGLEGPSIVQGSPAECHRVEHIEVDSALINRGEGQEHTRRRQTPILVCHMTRVSPLCRKDPGMNFQMIKPGKCGRRLPRISPQWTH